MDLTSDVVIGEEGRGGVYKTQVQVGVGRVERREERVGILDLVGIYYLLCEATDVGDIIIIGRLLDRG